MKEKMEALYTAIVYRRDSETLGLYVRKDKNKQIIYEIPPYELDLIMIMKEIAKQIRIGNILEISLLPNKFYNVQIIKKDTIFNKEEIICRAASDFYIRALFNLEANLIKNNEIKSKEKVYKK